MLIEGRCFIGAEITSEYFEIARERLGAAEADVGLGAHRAHQQPMVRST